jgi:hypothetical protein
MRKGVCVEVVDEFDQAQNEFIESKKDEGVLLKDLP